MGPTGCIEDFSGSNLIGRGVIMSLTMDKTLADLSQYLPLDWGKNMPIEETDLIAVALVLTKTQWENLMDAIASKASSSSPTKNEYEELYRVVQASLRDQNVSW